MRGDPWECAKWPKWAKTAKMVKNDKKTYGVLNFLLKYNAPILHPPHYAGKKLRKCLGEAHESAQTWEKPFFHIRPMSGMR